MRTQTRHVMALVLMIALSIASVAVAGGGETFRFAILGDRTGSHVPGVFPKVVREIALLRPDFVVTVGDHVEGYTDDVALANAEWDTLLTMLEGLGVPVYVTPGNHDITTDAAEPLYVSRTGRQPYYSFDHQGSHFVILDTSRIDTPEAFPEAQKEWLVDDLAAHGSAEHTFVFFHKPLWDQTLPAGRPDPLHDVLREHGVDAVFCGHYHTYFAADYDGIEYTVIGSSGGAMDYWETEPVVRGEFFQFGWVTVEPSVHHLAVVDLGGVYPRDVVTQATREEISRIENALVTMTPVAAAENTSVWAPVTVTVRNESDSAIEDVARWQVPDGWTVEPTEASFVAPTGGSCDVSFRLSNTGDLYPTPRLRIAYPLADGRPLEVNLPAPIRRTVTAARFAERPMVDGVLNDLCWRGAQQVSTFYSLYEDSRVEGETRFAFGYDDQNLYVGVTCLDSRMDALTAAVIERDGRLFAEDCVGFFFSPDPSEVVVYQIYANPLAAVFDQRISFDEDMQYTADPSWNGDYEVAAVKGPDGWAAEIVIPFRELGRGASPDHPWRLNFRRKQARTRAAADWQVPIDYNPATYGEMLFH